MSTDKQDTGTPNEGLALVGSGGGFGDFVVTGYALMPVEIKMTVRARTHKEAFAKAERHFQSTPRRRDYIMPGSEDASAVCDFRASEATPNTEASQPGGRRANNDNL